MILLLLACAPEPEIHDSPRLDSPGLDSPGLDGPVDTGATRPRLVSPDPAVDQDDSETVLDATLSAATATYQIGGETVDGYAYNGQVPGPTLRLRLGDTLRVTLDNQLSDPTTIHWHGVHAPFAMDGVPWMTDPVQPGESFTYEIVMDRAGSFFYHPHFDTARQVDLGLYGMLVVEDPADPLPDLDLELVFDAWGEDDAEGHTHGFDERGERWTVNGLSDPVLEVASGQVLRARLVNASNVGYLALRDVRVIGGEQGLRQAAEQAEVLVLAPGERADIEWRPASADIDVVTAPWSRAGEGGVGEDERLFTIAPSGSEAASPTLDYAFGGLAPSTDPGRTDVLYVWQGDEHTEQWLINGEAFPDVTIETLALGREAVIEVRNLSPTEHPFHLHGMPFEVLSVDGVAPEHRLVEDTINLGIRQVVRLEVLADNPGDWMTHCHILPHAEGGMMTVLRVE